MYKFYTRNILRLCLVIAGLWQMSCNDNKDIPDGAFEKTAKEVNGTWHISKVTRNGTDITTQFDFTQFELTMTTTATGEGSYTMNNKAPFLVSKNGTWRFDDPAYPLAVAFTEEGSESLRVATLFTPIIFDKPVLSFKLSPGCADNIYEYTLIADGE